jgi:malonyl-CoA O-methyltransferase
VTALPAALSAKAAYALLASDYDRAPNALVSLEQRTLAPLLPPLAGKTVIDVAAGTGRWAAYCSARAARALAIDSCREMLEHSISPAIQADAARLPLPDSVADLTICAFALGYAPACFTELARITRPGGTLLISDVHPNALASGWTRSFRHNGSVIEVAHERYALADLRAPELQLTTLEEPHLGHPEREIYATAGRLDLFHQARLVPAIFVASWIKT